MITDIPQLYTFITSLLDTNGSMTPYSILVRIVSYAHDESIEIPDMLDPDNSEIALDEIGQLKSEYVEAEIP